MGGLHTRTRLAQTRSLRRQHGAKRKQINPKRWLPASAAQRLKVIEAPCLVCGRTRVDAAHLVPQRLGGCEAPECVIPLCRTHHRLYDTGGLALALQLGPEHERELAHALCHVSEAELRLALVTGWPAPWGSGV
jgi:hypothetical protein